MPMSMLRLLCLFFATSLVVACTNPNDLDDKPGNLGNFHLGHNVVVAPNITKGPGSREADTDEWIASFKGAVDERFRRYDGSKLYHLGISIEGYVLAVPGVPIVASPKSVLIFKVTVWDDEAKKKLNDTPHQITVLETHDEKVLFGSGLTQSAEEQMENLSRNGAKLLEVWLAQQNFENEWFGGPEAGAATLVEQPTEGNALEGSEIEVTPLEPLDGSGANAAEVAPIEAVES
ncbi:hypothetical protein ROA7450_02620 [Roseovarius albus]|uniref:DUF4136 domain-containing protein n=1 Tax=Roseovarius albus TaxID=1247867 RepID=A0A1X6ZIF0_9RHOB|nr:hypothetical protein [Roseovarius albus]SLN52272.1 hypothetical protein ROA7450_02620 [Roseovarius albus]